MKNVKIRTKILTGIVLVNLIGMLVVAVYLHESYSGQLELDAQKSVTESVAAWDNLQKLETGKLTAALISLEANEKWQQQFASKNRAGLTESTADTFAALKENADITHWYFETSDGTVFLRAHKPEQFDDEITRATYEKAQSSGEIAAGLDLGKTAVALRVVGPYASTSGSELGFMETGQEVDKFVELLKEQTGADYALLLDKSSMDAEAYADYRDSKDLPNNWEDLESYVTVATTNEAITEEFKITSGADAIPESGRVVGIENGACSEACHSGLEVEDEFWTVAWNDDEGMTEAHTVFPIVDVNGKAIGVVYQLQDISRAADAAKAQLMNTLIVIIIGLVLATALIAVMMQTLVFGRLTSMVKSMEDISVRVAGGDFNAHYEPSGSNDEIGQFEQFFGKFMNLISNTLKSLVK